MSSSNRSTEPSSARDLVYKRHLAMHEERWLPKTRKRAAELLDSDIWREIRASLNQGEALVALAQTQAVMLKNLSNGMSFERSSPGVREARMALAERGEGIGASMLGFASAMETDALKAGTPLSTSRAKEIAMRLASHIKVFTAEIKALDKWIKQGLSILTSVKAPLTREYSELLEMEAEWSGILKYTADGATDELLDREFTLLRRMIEQARFVCKLTTTDDAELYAIVVRSLRGCRQVLTHVNEEMERPASRRRPRCVG